MVTEIFPGNPTALKARLDAIILSGKIINQVLRLAPSQYLIIAT